MEEAKAGKRPSVSSRGKPRGWKLKPQPPGYKGKPEYDFFAADAPVRASQIDPRDKDAATEPILLAAVKYKPDRKNKELPCNRVFLSGLSEDTDADFLEQVCEAFGKVKRVECKPHPVTGEHIGLGLVEFGSTADAVATADAYDNQTLLGTTIRVMLDPGGRLLTWTLVKLGLTIQKRKKSKSNSMAPQSPKYLLAGTPPSDNGSPTDIVNRLAASPSHLPPDSPAAAGQHVTEMMEDVYAAGDAGDAGAGNGGGAEPSSSLQPIPSLKRASAGSAGAGDSVDALDARIQGLLGRLATADGGAGDAAAMSDSDDDRGGISPIGPPAGLRPPPPLFPGQGQQQPPSHPPSHPPPHSHLHQPPPAAYPANAAGPTQAAGVSAPFPIPHPPNTAPPTSNRLGFVSGSNQYIGPPPSMPPPPGFPPPQQAHHSGAGGAGGHQPPPPAMPPPGHPLAAAAAAAAVQEESDDDSDDEEDEKLPEHTQKQIDNAPKGAWLCMKCGNLNYKNRSACNTTTCSRPRGRTRAIDGSKAPEPPPRQPQPPAGRGLPPPPHFVLPGRPLPLPPPPGGPPPPAGGDRGGSGGGGGGGGGGMHMRPPQQQQQQQQQGRQGSQGSQGGGAPRPGMLPGDWICPRPSCQAINGPRNVGCHRCDAGKYEKFGVHIPPPRLGGGGGGVGGVGGGNRLQPPPMPPRLEDAMIGMSPETMKLMIVVETLLPPNVNADVIRKDFRDPRPTVINKRNKAGMWCIEFDSVESRDFAYQMHGGSIAGIQVKLIKPAPKQMPPQQLAQLKSHSHSQSQSHLQRGSSTSGGNYFDDGGGAADNDSKSGGGGGSSSSARSGSASAGPVEAVARPPPDRPNWEQVEALATRTVHARLRESLKKHIARTIINKLAVGIVEEWRKTSTFVSIPVAKKKTETTSRPDMRSLASMKIKKKVGYVPPPVKAPAPKRSEPATPNESPARPHKKKKGVPDAAEPTAEELAQDALEAERIFEQEQLEVDSDESDGGGEGGSVDVDTNMDVVAGTTRGISLPTSVPEPEPEPEESIVNDPFEHNDAVAKFSEEQFMRATSMLDELDQEDLKHMLAVYKARIAPHDASFGWVPGMLKAAWNQRQTPEGADAASAARAEAEGVWTENARPSVLENDSGKVFVHKTGSARSDGYYPSTKTAKMTARKAVIARAAAKRTSLGLDETEVGKGEGTGKRKLLAKQASRANRANQRRLQTAYQSADFNSELLKSNPLKARKKQLRFDRSGIHGWGLFAQENIKKDEMVIEYIGEVIRQPVADIREAAYESVGMKSSYLFRLDDRYIVDATSSGYLARFMNHSCGPNCTAQVIEVEGEKKIVIMAQADIALGEEITYDYKFAKEDGAKLPCHCGSSKCTGYMN